jgi:uncharacterized protein YdhG (YjbR/CyaY superfamily)
MQSKETTVEGYLASLPEDRKAVMKKLRNVFKKNLPKGFREEMCYGMIGYVVPHSIYPKGYHCDPKQALPFLFFASQKNTISIYHMGIYGDPKLMKWFQDEHKKASPKKLDIGKSCIRYKSEADIPFELLATLAKKVTHEDYIGWIEKNLAGRKKTK